MEVPRVGVERAHLPFRGIDDARVAVADVGHVVVAVDITAAIRVEEILHRAADEVHRPAVGDAHVAADQAPARGENFIVGHAYGTGPAEPGHYDPQDDQRKDRRARKASLFSAGSASSAFKRTKSTKKGYGPFSADETREIHEKHRKRHF